MCDEPASARCRRCDASVCGFHGPWKDDLACRRCEEVWERSKRRRLIASAPAVLIAFGGGVLMMFAFLFVLARGSAAPRGITAIAAIVVVPVALAVAAARLADKRLRQRFLAFRSRANERLSPMS
jgi:hypothetical protein